ncbi:MAG: DUF853 family protein [Lachnospiraceae bacterium]|nr:DUF853 family protein [Lachnospiraceae bacterium]
MLRDGKIWLANTADGRPLYLHPGMANRHGLVAGATGTGKTVTLKVLAETFSDMGVPVFMADVKGDIAGIMKPGEDSENMRERIQRFGLAEHGFEYRGYPVSFWDIYGEKGVQLRTTITEMGPVLLARILGLNELQSGVLGIVFKIADDQDQLLIDTKDLKAMLHYVQEQAAELAPEYGRISPATIGAIVRVIVAIESMGGETFFAEPALHISDFLNVNHDGRGVISILDSESLVHDGTLYSTFLLWLLSELFESLPEVGDREKPKLVFFFDEAHLLFNGTPVFLINRIEQVVKLVRSKGVGVYFCTQNPRDIPDAVLAQLGNRIQHGLRAYTPAEARAVKAAAESFRENPEFNTIDAIQNLGTGEAVVSFLDEGGVPSICEKAYILPPRSLMGTITEEERRNAIEGSLYYSKYSESFDRDSAYEFLKRRSEELAAKAEEAKKAAEEAKIRAAAEKQAAKEAAAAEKQALKEAEAARRAAEKQAEAERKAAEREAAREEAAKKRAMKSVASTVAGTVGREAGKAMGGSFGSVGKVLGGNVGASLGRNILGTLFKT